jgi:hypothetical protein
MKIMIGILGIIFLNQGFASEGESTSNSMAKIGKRGAITDVKRYPSLGIFHRTHSDVVYARNFGAVGDGVTDDTVAIDAALASGAKEIKFGGVFKYIGQLAIPSGVTLSGESSAHSTLIITNAGYAVKFSGTGGKIRDMTIKCSRDGVDFSTLAGISTLNMIEHSRIIGPGRGVSSTVVGTPAQTTGINFNQARGNGAWAAYYNSLLTNYIRGFDVAVLFEAPVGRASNGGNANRAIDNQIADYWVAYDFMSIENEVLGGFFNNSLGNSSMDYGIAYRLRNGAYFNKIHPAAGEPGKFNVRVYQEAGAFGNFIASAPNNFSLGDMLLGGEAVVASEVYPVVATSFSDNAYYIQKIMNSPDSTYATAIVEVEWVARAIGAMASAAGSAKVRLWLSGNVMSAEYLEIAQSHNGAVMMLAGIYVSETNAAYLVWHAAKSNGNATVSGELNAKVSVIATGGLRRKVDMTMINVGTKNPSTYAIPHYEAAHNIGTVEAGESKVFSVTVPSTKVGNIAVASYSTSIAGLMMTASVIAENTVEVLVFNPTRHAITPVNGIIKIEARVGNEY